jgi:hypothetical protein
MTSVFPFRISRRRMSVPPFELRWWSIQIVMLESRGVCNPKYDFAVA